jgi:tetratricopeptide (TPR) repeat protein
MQRRSVTLAFVTAVAVAAPALVARAQLVEDYRFKGTTVDQSGAPVPKVKVTFRNTVSGAKIEFTSDDKGKFDRRMIPHAVYEATFEKPGFVTTKEKMDWSASAPDVILKEAQVVLQSESAQAEQVKAQAQKEQGGKLGALYQEAATALAASDCDKATKAANEALGMGAGPYEFGARYVVATCHAMKNELDAAVSEYQKVIALKPDLYEAHFGLANASALMKNNDVALQEFQKAVELKPEDAEAHYQIGAILFNQHKYEAAIEQLQKALELNPSHAVAAKALGFALIQGEKKDFEAAVKMLRRYLELQPDAADKAQITELAASLEKARPAASASPAHPRAATGVPAKAGAGKK